MKENVFYNHDTAVRHGLAIFGIDICNAEKFVNRVRMYSNRGLTVVYLDREWIFTVTRLAKDVHIIRYEEINVSDKIAIYIKKKTKCERKINYMDAKNLSKHKYIYRIYVSKTGEYHYEKYTIIYSNASYVYFKIHGYDRLCEVDIHRIHDSLQDITERCKFSPFMTIYLWNDEGISKESFGVFVKKLEIEYVKNEIIRTEARCTHLSTSLELASSKLKPLQKRLEDLEDEITKMDKTENV